MSNSPDREQVESLVLRLLYSLFYLLLLRLSWVLLLILAVVHYLYRVLNQNLAHPGIAQFTQALAAWYQQSTGYVMGASDDKAWPFADWPLVDELPEPVEPAEPIHTEAEPRND